ncbi:MAG: pentapeptide repeat-containing protein [Desmonostoc vinosum HA7617-LM4]|jgi:uncharacterized protein YjbI with pentapeptide repeats|nr:pentapeptide repeat-containing protein [Desmonostoc vinosum HA7617-LM4]
MPQDFSGRNLRGRSFKNQNLANANFSYADITSADFTDANLRNANFSHAKAGLRHLQLIGLLLVLWLMLGMLGWFSQLIFDFVISYVNSYEFTFLEKIFINVIAVIGYVVFLVASVNKNLLTGLRVAVIAGAVNGALIGGITESVNGALIGALVGGLGGTIAGIIFVAMAIAFAGAFALTNAGAIIAAAVLIFGLAFAGSATGVIAGVMAGVLIGIAAGASVLLSAYIGWRALAGEKNTWVRSLAINFAATGGTSFRKADLTNANFTKATLANTDLRNAILTHTCWHQVKLLNRVRPGKSYLQNQKICQLLVTGNGQNKNFEHQDLRGVYLQKANLVDASFIGTDLSTANLQNADLSRAKLVQTQLDGTDFTDAYLTGAFIQDWSITSNTKFDGVRCEYIYRHLPTQENPDPQRKPDNRRGVFKRGEFVDFIKPLVDTLDLYHQQEVDPHAIAISLKQLAKNHPEAKLEIVAIEKRGQDRFILRAKTAPTVDKSQLSEEYFATYNQLKNLIGEKKLLLLEKDQHIRYLENTVFAALQRPDLYSNTQIEALRKITENTGSNSESLSSGNLSQVNNNQQTDIATSNKKQLTQEDIIQMLAQIEQLLGIPPEPPKFTKQIPLKHPEIAAQEALNSEFAEQSAAKKLKRLVSLIFRDRRS